MQSSIRLHSALLVASMAVLSACTTTYETPPRQTHNPAEWIVVEPFPFESAEWQCVRRGFGMRWDVAAEPGGVVAYEHQNGTDWNLFPSGLRPTKREQRQHVGVGSILRVVDGNLVGWDVGEWGGHASWVSRNGRVSYEFLEANVIGFAELNDEVVAVSGLNHGFGSGQGAIHHLDRDNHRRWQVEETIDLGEAALAFTTLPGSGGLIIVTPSGVVTYSNGTITRVIGDDDSFINPTSVAVDEYGDLYVGMSLGIARIKENPAGYAVHWMMPPECPSVVRSPDGACECARQHQPSFKFAVRQNSL